MAKINRRYIDKHWGVFLVRGVLAIAFGFAAMFGAMEDLEYVIAVLAVFLLLMGIVDSTSALYASVKKRGWANAVVDALVDVAAALALLIFARGDLVVSLIILAVYTLISGVIDVFHGFVSTVDPTDRFMRILTGVLGCVMGFVIFNAGDFEVMMFIRFFGAYMLVVGVTSLIYGIHNRSQEVEDRIARKGAARKGVRMTEKVYRVGGKTKRAPKKK